MTKTTRPTVGHVFAGIDGLGLGLRWGGFGKTLWQIEKDPWRQTLLRARENALVLERVEDVGAELERPDAIVGGFPCRGMSDAGKREGMKNEQTALWTHFAYFDPPSHSWRMYAGPLVGDGGPFSGTWPRWGSMRNGFVSMEPKYPTPSAGRDFSCWPAPVRTDARSSGRHTTTTGVMNPGTSLTDAVRSLLRQDPDLSPHCEAGKRSVVVIHPGFVETLLGFPAGWTALEP